MWLHVKLEVSGMEKVRREWPVTIHSLQCKNLGLFKVVETEQMKLMEAGNKNTDLNVV